MAANLACCTGCAPPPDQLCSPNVEASRPEQFVELALRIEQRAGREACDSPRGVERRVHAIGPPDPRARAWTCDVDGRLPDRKPGHLLSGVARSLCGAMPK